MFSTKNAEIVFDLESNDELIDAAIISLHTNKRISKDELKEHHIDQGGYWGDLLDDSSLGSKLWILDREIQTSELLEDAKEYSTDSLLWMIDQGLANNLDVHCNFVDDNIKMSIKLDSKQLE
jgi:phage gp46-like protein